MKESSESTQKDGGLLYWSVRPSTWKTELLYCHYHTALDITDMSQLCLSVHVVKSPQLNSWAILSVHGVSVFSLKQVWDHSSQVFLPWWAKLSYTVSPFPQAKSTVGDSHHSVCSWHMRIFILQKWKTVIKAEDFHCPLSLKKNHKTNQNQTCLKTKLVH